MNEDPTIPIAMAETGGGARAEIPAASAVWGSFKLLARVGHGGFGEVYRAWDPHLQREVALKLLLPGAVSGEAEYEAMLREARALASLRHPNIVPVYGIDRHEGRVGFWTDFVRGKTLSSLVSEQGRFGAREAASIGLDVARALSAVHRAGLLHRDIKAENVMREEGGRILLMDFGLSALEQRQTHVAGTPNYMAPELFTGGASTVATDIYAMGVLLYFLVTGDYPVRLSGFTRDDALDAFRKSTPLIDLRPDLPEWLLRTVTTAMEMDPAKRFASAGQLANALAESLGTHAPVEMTSAPEQRRAGKPRWPLIGVAATALLAGMPLAWYAVRHRASPRAPGAESRLPADSNDEFQKAQDLLLASYKETNLAKAVEGFRAVLEKDPNNALAKARLGAAYLAQHGYTNNPKLLDAAREVSKQAIELDSELAAPYITLARVEAFQGQTQMATQDLQTALKLEPRSAEAYGARGELAEAQGRRGDAMAEYQKAIALDFTDWRWPMSLGVAEYRQGNLAEAIKQWQAAARLAPENAMAFNDLSIADRQSGNLEEARKEMEKALRLDPTARKYAALGSLLLFEGKFAEAEAMELKAVSLNEKGYEAYEDLAAAYAWSGKDHDKAVQAYSKAIELEEAERAQRKHDPALLATMADDYAAIDNREKSLALARQALALDADDPTVDYKCGETFETLGQRSEAIPLIAKAIANGYDAYELEHNPELASLRGDKNFTAALNELKLKKK